jgi:hypothetical protein
VGGRVRCHGIMVARDEADFIATSVGSLLEWCDTVHVLDTGSVDGTLERLREIGGRDLRLVVHDGRAICGGVGVRFINGVRAWVFERARAGFREGDWVARPDADEVFDVPVPEFVRERVEWGEGQVRSLHHEFPLFESEVRAWERGGSISATRSRYLIDRHPEIRLFRYRRRMRWPMDRANPIDAGLVAYERVPVRHYRARSVEQVQVRCAIRAAMKTADAGNTSDGRIGLNWSCDWRGWVWGDDMAGLRRVEVGERLPTLRSRRAAAWSRSRLMEQAYYRLGVARVRDMVRWGSRDGDVVELPRLSAEESAAVDAAVRAVVGNAKGVESAQAAVDWGAMAKVRCGLGVASGSSQSLRSGVAAV